MQKKYLTQYISENNIKVRKGVINLINAPCGSGKTTFIFSDEGIINNYKNFTTSKDNINLDEVLYITDTSMLKDKTLDKYKDITKMIDTKNCYIDTSNKINVMTYAQFGAILCNDEKSTLINKYKLIIMDEFHNLFYYNNQFGSIYYKAIIRSLNILSRRSILVALTATPYYVNEWNKDVGLIINNIISNKDELISYGEREIRKETYTENYIKSILFLYSKLKNHKKILIYTKNISVMKKYKKICELNGINAEMLWSVNSEQELSLEQLRLRQRLIEKGTLPKETDCLIVNESMATGWDLVDENINTVIVDDTNRTSQIQIRNRVRHDLETLVVREKEICAYDEYGCKTTFDSQSKILDKNIEWNFDYVGEYTDNRLKILMNNIDPKYLNRKLTKEDKEELVLRYTYNLGYKSVKFINFKEQFNKLNDKYEVFGEKMGTYIKKKGSIVTNKVKVRKDDNMNLVKEWLANEWDKERVPVNEVKDILDLGVRTYRNIIKDDNFIKWLDENNIEMTKIKGLGRTVYFKIK